MPALRVWIDVLTPKQVLFFKPLKEELESRGCEVLATSRHYREVEELANLCALPLVYVGARAEGRRDQLKASLERMRGLVPRVEEFGPDVSVSVASADCARVSFGLGIGHVAVNDSPHSIIAGRLSIPLSAHLLCPWVIPFSDWSPFGLARKQVTTYRALDPVAWLKRASPRQLDLGQDPSKRTIVIRVEESGAPYMMGTDKSWVDTVLKSFSSEFRDLNLVALCRYSDQLAHVKAAFGDSVIVPERAVDGTSLLSTADVFVGMGGTMTIEASLMGVPSVSAFQGGAVRYLTYLDSVGLLEQATDVRTMVRLARRFLKPTFRDRFRSKAKKLMDWMEDPTLKVTEFLLGAYPSRPGPRGDN